MKTEKHGDAISAQSPILAKPVSIEAEARRNLLTAIVNHALEQGRITLAQPLGREVRFDFKLAGDCPVLHVVMRDVGADDLKINASTAPARDDDAATRNTATRRGNRRHERQRPSLVCAGQLAWRKWLAVGNSAPHPDLYHSDSPVLTTRLAERQIESTGFANRLPAHPTVH